VDFNGKFLTIRRNVVHGNVNLPKNGKARRVDMSDALAEALQELKKDRKEVWLAKGQNQIPEWVFCNQEGRFLDTNNLRNRAQHKCLEDAKPGPYGYMSCAIMPTPRLCRLLTWKWLPAGLVSFWDSA
jgi:post-segregation antitoxin (ccd killing protein)